MVGLRASVLGDRREVLEALREGGPTKRAGAGRRLVCTLVALLLLVAMMNWKPTRLYDVMLSSCYFSNKTGILSITLVFAEQH